MVFYKPLKITQMQVKCGLSKNMPTHEKYEIYIYKGKTERKSNLDFKLDN